MTITKDPLKAATTSLLKPVASSLGFKKYGLREFARITNGVLQYFNLQLSAYGDKTFAVNFSSVILYSPHDHIVLQPGGRLPRVEGSNDGWWDSLTLEQAEESMRDVIRRFENHCLPFFEKTSTAQDLAVVLLEEGRKGPHPNAHHIFDAACCYAMCGDKAEATLLVQEAKFFYHQWYDDIRAAWVMEKIALCEQLASALGQDTERDILNGWYAHSLTSLKLGKIAAD